MRAMSKPITPEDRRRLAAAHGVNEQYLYQCLTARRDMNPAQARKLEEATGGELKRWALCQSSWFEIWPELIGTEGAPEPVAPVRPEAKAA